MKRRDFLTGLGATAALLPMPAVAQSACGPADTFRPVANTAFNTWVNRFQSRAASAGIRRETLINGFKGGGYLPDVVKRDRSQFQTRRTLEDYISINTTPARLQAGRAAMAQHRTVLNQIAAQHGVDPFIIAAIWGVETRYGQRMGDVPVISATATLAFDGRRGDFYASQLLAALRILQAGDVAPQNFKGSWAGAMGHTQFIPTSFLSFAVDHNRDGRRDVWGPNPGDALASTAAYLRRNGWRQGLTWGGERGVTGARGDVIRPQAGGPQFVITKNYGVLRRYNASTDYVITVGHLADRLRGGPPLRGGFPPDKYGFSRQDRAALQAGLNQRGFAAGDVDGVIGSKTRCAIQAFERRQGLAITGEPSQRLLRQLR